MVETVPEDVEKALDIVGYRYIRTEYREGAVIFTISRNKFNLRCPICKSKRIIKHGSCLRWFHSLPIGKKATCFTTTLEDHFEGILAYYDFDCLSTGPLEGTNNKIKTMQRKAYGYRDMEFFKLKIMALHETKYALVG